MITLAFICKDEEEILDKMLESTKIPQITERVCGWTGTNHATEAILKKHGVKYKQLDESHFINLKPNLLDRVREIDPDIDFGDLKLLPHFAHMRTASYELASNELVLWLDSDDILVGADQHMDRILQSFEDPRCGAVWFPYYYDFDENGNCTLELWRERITRKDRYAWVGAVHEVQLPRADMSMALTEDIVVRHTPMKDRIQNSAIRNVQISVAQLAQEELAAAVDARTLMDVAKSYEGCGQFHKALKFFERYLEESNWDGEKYDALTHMGNIFTMFSQYRDAIQCFFEAIRIDPFRKEAYFKIAHVYFKLEEWERVVYYTQRGFDLPSKHTIMPRNPDELTSKPLLPLQAALFQLGKFNEALLTAKKAREFYPDNQYLKDCCKNYSIVKREMDMVGHAGELMNYLIKHEEEKLPMFVQGLPEFAKEYPTFVPIINKYSPKESNSGKTIIFYCGHSPEFWTANNAESGIGGSEEATIHLSRRLLQLGWTVRIYNNCFKRETIDGVEYIPFTSYDQEHESCDIFVCWRSNHYADYAPAGSRVVVWLHDVQEANYWNPERTENKIDLIMPLSQWHRGNLKEIDDGKFWITRNGIDVGQFSGKHSRDYKRLVYASSPDRGLDTLLQMWPKIIESEPDAELHVFYGFTKTYDEMHKNNQKMKDWKEYMLQQLKQPGVVYWGRVGHKKLAEEFMKSAIWIYPTDFTEISCITAMKAQAAGAIPICTTTAALAETVQHGYKISTITANDERCMKTFVNLALKLLKDPELQDKIRVPMMKWAKEFFSWNTVAKEWDAKFKELLEAKK